MYSKNVSTPQSTSPFLPRFCQHQLNICFAESHCWNARIPFLMRKGNISVLSYIQGILIFYFLSHVTLGMRHDSDKMTLPLGYGLHSKKGKQIINTDKYIDDAISGRGMLDLSKGKGRE